MALDYSKVSGSNESSAQSLIGGGIAKEEVVNPLDNLSSADVAVHVARLTSLDESTAVVNRADSVNAQQAVTPADDQVIAKPQVICTDLKTKKDIRVYIAQQGDTVTGVADKFGVTSNTIRYSNDLTAEEITPGTKLLISPINGIVYTVQEGDTPDSLATKFLVNQEQLIAFNDAELAGSFRPGELIIIPDVYQPTSQIASGGYGGGDAFSLGGAFGAGYQASYGGNGYDYGWCTWHAAQRRIDIGRPIPNNLGNAISWLSLAQSAGLAIGTEPKAGAVVYQLNIGGLGHVAFVERVNSDGSIWVSDMNYFGHASMDESSPETGGWGTMSYRLVQPNEYGSTMRFIY